MYTALGIAEWGRARRFRKSRIGVCDVAILDYGQYLWEVLSSERFVIFLVSFKPRVFLFIVVMDYKKGT